jgi:hypothetical protein
MFLRPPLRPPVGESFDPGVSGRVSASFWGFLGAFLEWSLEWFLVDLTTQWDKSFGPSFVDSTFSPILSPGRPLDGGLG